MLHIKIDSELKIKVHRIADELGLSLSVIITNLLKKFVREKKIVFDVNRK